MTAHNVSVMVRESRVTRVATFADLLARQLSADPGRPLVTYYDLAADGGGERVELSVATYANWVAKTASLLVEECDLERGQALLVDLPAHWLTPVFLGAAWSVGLTVLFDEADRAADAIVCGPDTLATHAERANDVPVIATALLPMGRRFPDWSPDSSADPLPEAVLDFGADVWSQPDSFFAFDPPQAEDPAIPGLTQAQLCAAAAAGSLLSRADFTDGGRLLAQDSPASPSGLACFVEPLVRGGSIVLIPRLPADAQATARLAATCVAERVTAGHPARL